MSRNLSDLKEAKGRVNIELNEYLENYRRDTGVNMGTTKNLKQLTRKY